MRTSSWRSAALLVFALTLLSFGFASSQRAVAQSWGERFQVGRQQQPFLTQYVNDHPPEQPLTPSRVDAYLQTLEQVWKREIDASASTPAWKTEVSPVLYYYLLRTQVVGESLSKEVRCHLFAQHMTPAFLESVARYEEAPTTGNLYPVSSSVGFGFPTRALECEIETAQWSALQKHMEQLPNLLETHLNRHGNDLDGGLRSHLEREHKRFEQLQPVLAVRGLLYRSELNTAFAELAALSARNDDGSSFYIKLLGDKLWRRYEAADQTDQALATLDLMARTLTAADLPRDSLRTWYQAVDSERGPKRYLQMTGESSLPVLTPSETQIQLFGEYLNVTAGEPFDLTTLKGKVVLFDFWATWCAPCIEEIPDLKALVEKHGDEFVLVSVSGDAVTGGGDKKAVKAFVERHGINYIALYDDPEQSLTERFNVSGWPSKFLVNEEGVFLTHPTEKRRTITLAEVDAYLSERE